MENSESSGKPAPSHLCVLNIPNSIVYLFFSNKFTLTFYLLHFPTILMSLLYSVILFILSVENSGSS